MCFEERSKPAAIVGCLSVILFLIAVGMIILSVRFNNEGLSTDLGSMGDYTNFAFFALLAAAISALLTAICGCLVCKIPKRWLAVCFGCTLLPAALIMTVFGFLLTGISHTDEEKFQEFCVEDYAEFNSTSAKDEWTKKLRETIDEVDYKIGGLVSEVMCSNICPCDITEIPEAVTEKW